MNKYTKIFKLLVKNPQLAAYKAKITFKNRVTARFDYWFMKGAARSPACICIKLTNACNLRCRMCGQPREGHKPGDAKYAPPEFFKQSVSLDHYAALVDQVKSFNPNIYLWGGEPFLYKDIFKLIDIVKSNNLTCQINTNGMYLKKYASEIVESGLDDLIISIDGPEAIHDTVRGRQGTFELVKTGVEQILHLRKQKNVTKPVIRVRGTICPENFEHIYSLADIAKEFGADSLNFNWTWFTTQKTGQAHQKLMKKLFDIKATSWIPFQSDIIMDKELQQRFDGIRKELEKFKTQPVELPVSISPDIKPHQVEDYYTQITNTFGSDTCYAIYVKAYILPNGDVTPCPDYPDYITGNITRQSFVDIWNGPRYRQWRQEIKKRDLFPICYRCCDLFLSNVKFI